MFFVLVNDWQCSLQKKLAQLLSMLCVCKFFSFMISLVSFIYNEARSHHCRTILHLHVNEMRTNICTPIYIYIYARLLVVIHQLFVFTGKRPTMDWNDLSTSQWIVFNVDISSEIVENLLRLWSISFVSSHVGYEICKIFDSHLHPQMNTAPPPQTPLWLSPSE